MKILKLLFKNETVFAISFLLAVGSMFFIHPDAQYLAYPDYRTLTLLFCLMIIVAGLQSLGIFFMLGQMLLKGAGSIRKLCAVMVILCFFCSMIITNDVTLITFVPFTILVFRMGGRPDRLMKLIVLETRGQFCLMRACHLFYLWQQLLWIMMKHCWTLLFRKKKKCPGKP